MSKDIPEFVCAVPPGSFCDDEGGMTLRDYFAGQALVGFCLSLSKDDISNISDGILGGKRISRACYAIADAMIKERDKPHD